MWPGTSFCSCPPAWGAARLQQHRGIMSVRSKRNRGGGECSGFLMAQVEPSEKAQPFLELWQKQAGCHHADAQLTSPAHFSWWQHRCLQLTYIPHLTSAKGARSRFLGQSQPSGIPPAKPDAGGNAGSTGSSGHGTTITPFPVVWLWELLQEIQQQPWWSLPHSQHTAPALKQSMF